MAQVWRDGARQARLTTVLKAVQIHPLDDGRAVGALLAASGLADVADAHVVLLGAGLAQRVLTGDPGDASHRNIHRSGKPRHRRVGVATAARPATVPELDE